MQLSDVVIVTRTKNRPSLLQRAINSVRLQTFKNYHHVIVNDGGDIEVINHLFLGMDVSRITVIHNQHSLGMESASNIGLKHKQAKYAVIHDDDDSWHPDFLMQSVNYLNTNEGAAGVVCNILQCFERVQNNAVSLTDQRLYNPAVKRFIRDDFLVTNQFVPIAFLYRYDLHSTIGFYNEALSVCGDLEFFLRILEKHHISKMSNCLANYHIRINNDNSPLQNSVSDARNHLRYSFEVLAKLDDRTTSRKLISWCRVRIYYRLCNILFRSLSRPEYCK